MPRRVSFRVLPLVLAAGLLAAAASAAEPGVVIKLATLLPQGSAWHTALLEMGERWRQASAGRVTLRIYPGGVAGDDGDVVRKMRLKTLDAGLLTAAGFGDIDRSIFALELPMGFDSYDELDFVLSKMEPMLESVYAEKGFVVLGWADAGWVRFFSKSPVRTPDDLKALKLFTWAGDDPAVQLWRSAGFNPVPLPSTEISTALQTGLVSALPTTPQAALLLQWYNNAKYMADVKWAVLLGGLVVTKSAWDEVPADARQALRDAARETARKLGSLTREAESSNIDAMVKHGLTVVPVTGPALEAWHRAAESAYPRLRGGFVPAEAFDEALKFRDEYRKGRQGKASR
ncbi:MAG TPA: TRAP transporter substrate-binding protein DctP [Thermoanaerobaculaceae bacterium]|nr:TRAP transporter substrate-binding protein DctP [Thermoanaerobaculaceae bacterium]